MAIRILKHGKAPPPIIYEGSCPRCECVFEADATRQWVRMQADWMFCPECGHHTELVLREGSGGSLGPVPLTPALSPGEREKEAAAIVNTECGA